MLTALALACALAPSACHSTDAQQIATAIDAATDSPELRAVLVTYAWHESRFRVHPRAVAWDARAGIARGPWQLWFSGDADLTTQAKSWLWNVQRSGLASVDSSPTRAARRAAEAARLLSE